MDLLRDPSSPQFSFLTLEEEEIACISFLSTNVKIKIRLQNQCANPEKLQIIIKGEIQKYVLYLLLASHTKEEKSKIKIQSTPSPIYTDRYTQSHKYVSESRPEPASLGCPKRPDVLFIEQACSEGDPGGFAAEKDRER